MRVLKSERWSIFLAHFLREHHANKDFSYFQLCSLFSTVVISFIFFFFFFFENGNLSGTRVAVLTGKSPWLTQCQLSFIRRAHVTLHKIEMKY